jgi:hypothetical protein
MVKIKRLEIAYVKLTIFTNKLNKILLCGKAWLRPGLYKLNRCLSSPKCRVCFLCVVRCTLYKLYVIKYFSNMSHVRDLSHDITEILLSLFQVLFVSVLVSAKDELQFSISDRQRTSIRLLPFHRPLF